MDLAPQQDQSSTDIVSEHTEFQSHMPYMGISRGSLTMQQEKLVSLISSGMTTAAAGRGAGYSSPQSTMVAMLLVVVRATTTTRVTMVKPAPADCACVCANASDIANHRAIAVTADAVVGH